MAKKAIQTPKGVSVREVETSGSKPDFFIARHEATRTQFTGDTAEEALEKLQAHLDAEA